MGEISRRGVRELRHLVTSGAMSVAALALACLTLLAVPLSTVGIGRPLLVRAVRLTRRLADVQRRRWESPIPSPYPEMRVGLRAELRIIGRTPATWRDFVWLALHVPVGATMAVVGPMLWVGSALGLLIPLVRWLLPPDEPIIYNLVDVDDQRTAWLVVPFSLPWAIVAYVLPRMFIAGEERLARWLLAPTAVARLSARVEELTETRTATVDASAAELRRIERDLHDGAQARLVSLAMNLGMAEDMLDTDPGTARAMLADARAGAHLAMRELRDLVRGIHPPLLADRGPAGALQALALECPIPIDLDVRLARRLPVPVESAAYFTMAEALANAIKHSEADRITLTLLDLGDRLSLRVHDDGRGGADPSRGSGLQGIRRRLAVFDGSVRVTSPVGGPTLIEAELPCGS